MQKPSSQSILGAVCLSAALSCSAALAQDPPRANHHHEVGLSKGPAASPPKDSPVVQKVRAATRRYRDINVALGEGWVPATPCVSGPNAGAMGVHLILPARVEDPAVNAEEPEALIYEPLRDGRMRLVGVEFIVIAEAWDTANPDAQPQLDGHLMNYVGAPNRYRLPAFYEIHVWAWEGNPDGTFADFNRRVSCELQPAES